jgi:prenyltransferase beta subunit
MKRIAALLVLFVCLPLHAEDADAKKQTIAYVRSLQTEEGGFRPTAKGPPGLKATSAAVRALHYLGGELPNQAAAAKFVASCFDPKAGGFADAPGGKVDVFSTAVGLMAVVALKMPTDRYAEPAGKYLSANAKGFEDIRIAVAGFEAIEKSPPKLPEWTTEVKKTQNADGTFGTHGGAGVFGSGGDARDTGGAVVALLRMRWNVVANRDSILATLCAGQRSDGGFGKKGADSDLESSYRILRCFAMMKAQPDRVGSLHQFIEKCRNDDGGYGVSPGQPSNVGGVYYAAIIEHWLARRDP